VSTLRDRPPISKVPFTEPRMRMLTFGQLLLRSFWTPWTLKMQIIPPQIWRQWYACLLFDAFLSHHRETADKCHPLTSLRNGSTSPRSPLQRFKEITFDTRFRISTLTLLRKPPNLPLQIARCLKKGYSNTYCVSREVLLREAFIELRIGS
jgi:hypothetical protein